MNWFYRLQQRLALTRPEAFALGAFFGLLIGGMAVRAVQGSLAPLPPEGPAPAQVAQVQADARGLAAPVGAGSAATESDAAPAREATPAAPPHLNLNTASAKDLERLPGIGPSKARAIVEYRTSHGRFGSVDELDQVKGFGKKTVDKLREYLRVE